MFQNKQFLALFKDMSIAGNILTFRWVTGLYQNYPRLRQVVSLLSANIIAIPLSIVSNIFITRFLGKDSFGDFRFVLAVFGFAITVLNVGFFQAGNRAIVLSRDPQKSRELYGSMLVILGGIFLVLALSITCYAFIDRNVAEKGVRTALLYAIPFSWMFLLVTYFEVLFQADNKISLLAQSRLTPKIIFFIAVAALYFILKNFSGNRLMVILMTFLISHIAAFLYILHKVNPSFRNFRERTSEIWHYNKTFGFNVYIGSVFSVALSNITALLISYFSVTNAGVGYFQLAATISDPLSFIPNVIATTHYKEFSTRKHINKRLTIITMSFSLGVLLLCWLLVGPFIKIFYGHEYTPVIPLTIIVSSGMIMYGLADYFNRFLLAHGQGKALRNSAIMVGIVLLVSNVTLVPLFGTTGAAFIRVLSGLTYLLGMLYFYKKLVKKLNDQPETAE